MTDSPTPPPPPSGAGTPPPAAPGGATPPPAGGVPYPSVAAARPADPGSATTLIWRRRDRPALIGALTAIVVAWVITLALHVVYVIQGISYALNDGLQYVGWSIADFFFYGVWQALFFYGPAFLALWLFLPLVKESTLVVVLKRAAAAGLVGLAGLIIFGLFDGIWHIIQHGFYFGYFGVDLLWGPIANAIFFTVQLLVGATIAWLRAHRPARAAPVAPASPAAQAAPATPTAPAGTTSAAPAAPPAPTPPANSPEPPTSPQAPTA